MPGQRNGTRFAIKSGGAELIPELKPLWDALFDHHLSTGAAGIQTIPAGQSWPLRRAHYERLASAQPDLTIYLATDRVDPVGYALCYKDSGDPGPGFEGEWASRSGTVLETMVVVPRVRGTGLGSELMDRFEAKAAQPHDPLAIVDVMGGNESAAEFYRHRGYLPRSETWMRVRVPATGFRPTAPLPGPAATAFASTVTRTGFNLEMMPGPDDTWVTPTGSHRSLPCRGPAMVWSTRTGSPCCLTAWSVPGCGRSKPLFRAGRLAQSIDPFHVHRQLRGRPHRVQFRRRCHPGGMPSGSRSIDSRSVKPPWFNPTAGNATTATVTAWV